MCGRFYLDVDFDDLLTRYDLRQLEMDYNRRHEIFPTESILALPQQQPDALIELQWGIQQPYLKQTLINARSESILEKPLFQKLALINKCLIPASGYYEWKTEGKQKTKHRLWPKSGEIISFAGLYGHFRIEGKLLAMAVILTEDADGDLAGIHPRKPVILSSDEEKSYLSIDHSDALLAFLAQRKKVALTYEIS